MFYGLWVMEKKGDSPQIFRYFVFNISYLYYKRKEGYVILSEKAYEEITKQGLNAEDIEDYMIANIENFNNDYLTILDVLAQYREEMLLS